MHVGEALRRRPRAAAPGALAGRSAGGRGRGRARPRRGPAARRAAAPRSPAGPGAAVREHQRQPLRRVRRVERHVGAARLEDAEQGHHHRRRALDAEPHQHLGADAQAPQVVGQPVGPRVRARRRSGVSRRPDTAGASGRPRRLRREQLVDQRARRPARPRCRSRRRGAGARSAGGQQRQLREPALRGRQRCRAAGGRSGPPAARPWRRRRGRCCTRACRRGRPASSNSDERQVELGRRGLEAASGGDGEAAAARESPAARSAA